MLIVPQEQNITVRSNTPTIIGISVKSEFQVPVVVTVSPSCGCTVLKSNTFTIEPYLTHIQELTLTRSVAGYVNVSFVVNGQLYTTKLLISII